jgi:hypothetical protein
MWLVCGDGQESDAFGRPLFDGWSTRVKTDQPRIALLTKLYRKFLAGQATADFIQQISACYTVGTLERLAVSGNRESRRAAVLALGLVGNYASNAVVGCALIDADRGVRSIAENTITTLWRRDGTEQQRQRLGLLVRLNSAQQLRNASSVPQNCWPRRPRSRKPGTSAR